MALRCVMLGIAYC